MTDANSYSLSRPLKKGCPKIMKLVHLAHDEMTSKQYRKPNHQFVASIKKMTLSSHNKYGIMGTITNNSASTAPASGIFKSNAFDLSKRISI